MPMSIDGSGHFQTELDQAVPEQSKQKWTDLKRLPFSPLEHTFREQ